MTTPGTDPAGPAEETTGNVAGISGPSVPLDKYGTVTYRTGIITKYGYPATVIHCPSSPENVPVPVGGKPKPVTDAQGRVIRGTAIPATTQAFESDVTITRHEFEGPFQNARDQDGKPVSAPLNYYVSDTGHGGLLDNGLVGAPSWPGDSAPFLTPPRQPELDAFHEELARLSRVVQR